MKDKVALGLLWKWLVLGICGLMVLYMASSWWNVFAVAWNSHGAVKVGEAYQKECDGYYFENESARGKGWSAMVKWLASLNHAIGAFQFVYLVVFTVVCVTIVVRGLWTAKDRDDNRLKWIFLGLLVFLVWGALVAAASNGTFYNKLPANLPSHPSVKLTSIWAHVLYGAGVLALTAYLLGQCNESSREKPWWFPSPLTALGTAIVLFSVLSLITPPMYNKSVVAYETLRNDMTAYIGRMPQTDRDIIHTQVTANYFAVNKHLFLPEQATHHVVDYAQHERGNEFNKLNGKDADKLREKMKELRTFRQGPRAIREWTRVVMLVTIALVLWMGWTPYMAAYRFDNMALGGTGLKYFFAGIMIVVFALTFLGWFTIHGIHVD